MLTQKQELFTLNLFSGMTQRESWIKAGYSSNYALKVIDSNACALANRSKIKVRLQELYEPTIAIIESAKEDKLNILKTIYNHEPLPDKISAKDRILAISEHNKMEGDYAPSRVKVESGNLGDAIEALLSRIKSKFRE